MSKWIETERLILRPFRLNDWRSVLKYTSKPEVWKYLTEAPYTDQEARQLVANNVGLMLDKVGLGEHLPVILKPSHQLIGHMIFRVVYLPYRTMEMGFIIDPEYQGKGYATEAADALLQHSFETLDIHRVVAICDPENAVGCRVMEKIGMRQEALFQKAVLKNSKWRDQYVYAILADEWNKK